MSEQDDKRSLLEPAGGAVTPGGFADACADAIRREMPRLLGDLFSKLDDALYDLADKAESNSRYTTYFDTMRVFRRERRAIEARFLQKLLEGGEALIAGDRGRPPGPVGARRKPDRGLALMKDAELEESLAIANLISKAETRYRPELNDLRRHLGALLGRESVDSHSDPLGPHAICNAFRAALKPVNDMDLAVRLIVYKLFDKQVMDRLGGIYEHCAACAAATELAPQTWSGLQPEGGAGPAGHVPRPPAAGVGPSDAGAAARSSGQHAPAVSSGVVFTDLQRLLDLRRPRNWGSGGATVVATGELLFVLSRLQGLARSDGECERQAEELHLRLREELDLGRGGETGRTLGRTDEDTLDLVLMLFESILQGNDLPDPIKAQIGRLQIPILKVALADKSFFDDANHPARRLLNHLAQMAIGWTDDGDRSPASVYGRIERTVGRIVRDFDRDSAIFAELDRELVAALAREQEQAHTSETKAQRELEGKERHRAARAMASEVIAARLLAHGRVPDAVAALLREGWQEVMLAAYLRDGEGEEWRSTLATLDRLLWSIEPKVEYGERRELLRGIPELLRTLRESLAEVSFDQRRLARWFKDLQALHLAALRGAGAEPTPAGAGGTGQRPAGSVKGPATAFPSAPGPASAAARVQVPWPGSAPVDLGLDLGNWIEVRRDDGQALRIKLAWRSPASDLYLFVDRRGHRAMELTSSDLSTLIAQGMARVLGGGDAPLVDRAMEAVFQSLKAD